MTASYESTNTHFKGYARLSETVDIVGRGVYEGEHGDASGMLPRSHQAGMLVSSSPHLVLNISASLQRKVRTAVVRYFVVVTTTKCKGEKVGPIVPQSR